MKKNYKRYLSLILIICFVFTMNFSVYADPNSVNPNPNENQQVVDKNKNKNITDEDNIKYFYDKEGKEFKAFFNKDGKIEKVIAYNGDTLYYGENGKPNKIITSDGRTIESSDPAFITSASAFWFVLPIIELAIMVVEETIFGLGAIYITTNYIEQTIYYNQQFPTDPEKLDFILGTSHQHIPDGPETPNRLKRVWKLRDDYEVVYEQHPYDTGAPASHTGPHYHINTPYGDHLRYLPGKSIPTWVFDYLLW